MAKNLFNNIGRIQKEYQQTEQEYKNGNYAWPLNSLALVDDMYKQLAEQIQDGNGDNANMEDLGELCALKMLTMTKLLTSAMDAFRVRPDAIFSLSFLNGNPTKETLTFFNLQDDSGEFLDYEKTSMLKLPSSFCFPRANSVVFNLSQNGEEIFLTHLESANEQPTEQ